MHINDVETPALLIDLDIMERNLCRVAEYTRAHGLRLRPHTKTHKIPALGRRQVELGAAGLTVAKVGEAEVMRASGTPDMLVAYPVLGRRKLERLMAVARETQVTIALDSLEAARELSEAAGQAQVEVGVLAEFDAGLTRVGVTPGEELVRLVEGITQLPRIRFAGITCYPGHIRALNDEGQRALDRLGEVVGGAVEGLRHAGFEPGIVSAGSTPTLFQSHRVAGVNEIRPGTYIFNDRNTWAMGACALADCAAWMLTTIVSIARPGQVIVDGGSKTFSSDRLAVEPEATFGYVVDAPEAVFHRMNEEHGYIDIRNTGRKFAVGERWRIIPNHICAAMNLHETVYGIRGGEVVTTWKVEGRGKLQ
jgi:D-serine deaminase-like pyridoxal phosphate-dependent protein